MEKRTHFYNQIHLPNHLHERMELEGAPEETKILAETVFSGLVDAYHNHCALGESGREKNRQNRFGDMALKADVEAEEIILTSLKRYSELSKVKVFYQGEEMGTGEIIDGDQTEAILAVFDGLDGSGNFLNPKDWPYGTMVAIADNENPTYKDFKIAGISLMEEGLIILAIKNVGVIVYDVNQNEFKELKAFDKSEEFDDTKTLANKYFPEEFAAYGDNIWAMKGSTAASISAICIGKQIKDEKYPAMNDGWNGLIEVTRKNNLEQPILYLLITTLGGVMVDQNGKSIGDEKFKDWGQKNPDGTEDRQIVVTAKNKIIANAILSQIKI